MSTSYGLIIEFSRNEKQQKYRIILCQHTNYLHKWLVPFLTCLLLSCLFFLLRDSQICASQEQAGPPRLTFYGVSKLDMMNTVWLGSIPSEIFFQVKFSILKAVSSKRLPFYLGRPLHAVSSFFSHFCFFQNAILHKMLKLRFWNFKPVFLRIEFSLVATFLFSSFGYLFELIFASYTVSWVFTIYTFNIWRWKCKSI